MNQALKGRLSAGLFAFAMVISQIIMPVQTAFATQPEQNRVVSQQGGASNGSNNGNDKVFVCKYVSTPGVGEVASQIISVAVNSQNNYVPGDLFTDQQGLSYVIAEDNNQPAPPLSSCPKFVALPAMPSVDDPCNSVSNPLVSNVTWGAYSDTVSYTWMLNDDTSLTATVKDGYKFKTGVGTYVTSVTFQLPDDNNLVCKTTVQIPDVPSVNDACGPLNAVWVKPADTAQYTWTVTADGHLVVTAKNGFVFAGNKPSHDYGVAPDSGDICIVKIQVPSKPSVYDPCNENGDNASWKIPADTNKLDWGVVNDELIVTTKTGYSFNDGSTVKNFGTATDSGIKCAYPEKPYVIDRCGRLHDKFIIKSTEGVTYKHGFVTLQSDTYLAKKNVLIIKAVANEGYELKGKNVWVLKFTNRTCKPDAEVKLATYCTEDGQKYNIGIYNPTASKQWYEVVVKDEEGVEVYTKVLKTHAYDSKWTSWMATLDGEYKISVYSYNHGERGDKLWQTKVDTSCAADVFTPVISKVDQNGLYVSGARFTVVVCQYDRHGKEEICKTYEKVDFGTNGNWFAEHVKFDHYRATKVTITETYVPPTCTNDGPWTFTWSYDKHQDDGPEVSRLLLNDDNGHYSKTGSWKNGSNEWKLVNNCVPGQGSGGGETPAPRPSPIKGSGAVVGAGELPEELPMTGAKVNLVWVAGILLAVATYGAVYFAQPKKRFDI